MADLQHTEWHMTEHQSAGWFPQQQLQTLLGVAVGVTSNCALCQVYQGTRVREHFMMMVRKKLRTVSSVLMVTRLTSTCGSVCQAEFM